jgi:hypothetical protein
MATHYEDYVRLLQLPVWTACKVTKASYSQESHVWDVAVTGGAGKEVGLRSKYVVFAIGGGGQLPAYPVLSNRVSGRLAVPTPELLLSEASSEYRKSFRATCSILSTSRTHAGGRASGALSSARPTQVSSSTEQRPNSRDTEC